jgi:predicted ATP-grasp superfamily ATP-dependent carboligase/CelD/BcsL family acetyltransferase involved in cellulose biosynthesis
MKVLVTDGENRAALAITRSLGRLGHEVLVGDKRESSLAQTSRYCSGRIRYPEPIGASEAFVDTVARIAREQRVDVVMPVSDITTFLLSRHRERFSCVIACADYDVVELAANKVAIVDVAERIGVPVPRSLVVESPDALPAGVDRLGFPLVIKPWRSRVWTSHGWASTAVSYAANLNELISALARRPAHEFPMLLQERIIGPGMGVFMCYHDGKPVAEFSHRRLRERPPWGGVSVLSESATVDPAARDYSIRLLNEIEWAGVAMVEFKQDTRDGVPKLMEINGRFWGSLQLAIDSGVDFPAVLMRAMTGEAIEPPPPYRVPVRNRWFWGDVDSLLVTMRGGSSAQFAPSRADKVRTLREFFKLRGSNLYYDNPKWDDPRPFLTETRGWFRKLGEGFANGRQKDSSAPPSPEIERRSPARIEEPVTPTRLYRKPKIQIVSSFDQVGLDGADWNALVSRSATNTIFQTHQWARSWAAVYGAECEPLFVTASDSSGTIAVAPLVVEQTLSRERVVRFLGDGRADYSDVLSPSDRPELTPALLTALLKSRRWDRIELNNIPEHSSTAAALRECCRREGFAMLTEEAVCPALAIKGHEDGARQILNKPSLRRRQHYFEKHGNLEVKHLSQAADISPLLEQFFDQHVSRWDGTGSPSLFLEARNREFYRELTESFAGCPWLMFTVVNYNGHPIAFHYGFDYQGTVTWYKPSFDVAFAKRSPGLTLLRCLIDYAVDHQRDELDFTVGQEPFKMRFTNTARTTVRLHVFRDHVRFALERANRSLRSAVRRASGAPAAMSNLVHFW